MSLRPDEGEINKWIGERIRQLRTHKKIYRSWLARRIGVTYAQIQKYENGSNSISAARLFMIAKALKVPFSCFDPESDTLTPALDESQG